MALSKKNLSAFLSLAGVIAASIAGYTHATAESVKPFADEGLVEVNTELTNESGTPAVRLTEAGNQLHASHTQPQGDNSGQGASIGQTATSTANSGFNIVADVPLPGGEVRGRAGTYPFDDLQVNGSFFVPNTAEKPNAAKSMASTVSSATARYATEVAGETVKNRKGNIVPKTIETRKFVVRPVKDGAPWGFPGQAGAGVWRTA